jgi:tetratricopeptide (TPR) repeat protein
MLRVLKILTITLVLALSSLIGSTTTSFSREEEMYNRAQYEAAIETLKPFPTEPEALRITGKSFFMLGDFRKAIQYFQKLVTANPLSAIDFHWLGKAWARRAESSNPVSSSGYSAKARRNLERASELDPKNVAVLKDLLEQYLDSRNLDRAKALAERISSLDAEAGRTANMQVINRSQELRTPEEKLREWVDQIPQHIGQAVDMARSADNR